MSENTSISSKVLYNETAMLDGMSGGLNVLGKFGWMMLSLEGKKNTIAEPLYRTKNKHLCWTLKSQVDVYGFLSLIPKKKKKSWETEKPK